MKYKYFVVLPGLNMLYESLQKYDEFVKYIQNKIASGEPLIFTPNEGNTVIFYPSANQCFHIVIMNEEQFLSMQREQALNQARQNGQGILLNGKR